jgi:hypothetical protein
MLPELIGKKSEDQLLKKEYSSKDSIMSLKKVTDLINNHNLL